MVEPILDFIKSLTPEQIKAWASFVINVGIVPICFFMILILYHFRSGNMITHLQNQNKKLANYLYYYNKGEIREEE